MPRIGSMIETPPGYGHLTGMENMRIVQKMLRLSDQQINDALALVGLSAYKDRLQRQYSLGMKQRLGIAIALARQPQLLVLDEPTNGLDPAGIEEIRELLIHLADEGVTVMVSSHLLDEVDKMASVIGILSEGKLVFQGSREKLFSRSVPDVIISTPQAARAHTLGFPGSATPRSLIVPGCREEDVARLIVELVRADIPIYEVSRAPQRLEDVFMDLTALNGGQQ